MTHERPWLANYPEGIPAEIDADAFDGLFKQLCHAIIMHVIFAQKKRNLISGLGFVQNS